MLFVHLAAGKVVERFLGRFNNMFLDELGSFSGALFGAFDTAFPFHNCPHIATVLGKFTEDSFKIDLSIAQRTVASGSVGPIQIAAKGSFFACRIKF